MKKFLIAALVSFSSLAFSSEVVLMEQSMPVMSSSFHTYADARFHMDMQTGEGFVKVSVTEDRWIMTGHYDTNGRWYPHRTPMPVTVFSDTIKVQGLMMVDKKVIYQGPQGEVNCGKMGVSRVLKVPTLYLNGNCSLSARLTGRWSDQMLKVTLSTK